MTLVRRRGERGLLPSLSSNLLDMFDLDEFMNEPFKFPVLNNAPYYRVPATNIRETKDEYIVELAAPGLKKKDFIVDIDNNMLEIKVENEAEKEEKKAEFTRREYNYNAFYRSFTLPQTVNAEKIRAEYIDGVLKVHLPFAPEAKKRKAKEIAVS